MKEMSNFEMGAPEQEVAPQEQYRNPLEQVADAEIASEYRRGTEVLERGGVTLETFSPSQSRR